MRYKYYPKFLCDDYKKRGFSSEIDERTFFFVLKNAAITYEQHLRKGFVDFHGIVDVDDYAQESFLRYYAAKAAGKCPPIQIVAAKQGCSHSCCANFAGVGRKDASPFHRKQETKYDDFHNEAFESYGKINYTRITNDVFEDDDFKEIARDLVERFSETLTFNDRQLWTLNLHGQKDDFTRLCMIAGKSIRVVKKTILRLNKEFLDFVLQHKHEYETKTFILGVPKENVCFYHDRKNSVEKGETIERRLKRYEDERKKKTGKTLMLKGGL